MAETPKNSKPSKRTESWWSKNWFYITLVLVAVIGGGCAFTLPYYFQREGDNIWSLRQAILAATGGVLAILTLWENRRKNIQEKEKNDQDHTRQVHAERRARYAKAVEQLADAKAPIRLGGVYTLVKLVDEWLADEKTLPDKEERREEGQVIINSLCAYIRSSFDLASKAEMLSQDKTLEDYEGGTQQFAKDQARFREEKELRLTIIEAIRTRLTGGFITQEDGTKKLLKGSWSNFDYDFSNAHFFYPVDFANIYFGASSNFFRAEFAGYAGFSGAKFTRDADFSEAEFTWDADFSEAEFTGYADFSEAEFTGYAHFSEAEFTGYANFFGAKFTWDADFSEAEFTGYAHFFGAKFTGDADFSEAEFTKNANFSGAKFTGDADFSGATFTQGANFSYATFEQDADFSKTTFKQNADRREADFSGATFTQGANFSKAIFWTKPIFNDEPYTARFSNKVKLKSYNFQVSHSSPYEIDTDDHRSPDGTITTIPKGCIVFDSKTGEEIPHTPAPNGSV